MKLSFLDDRSEAVPVSNTAVEDFLDSQRLSRAVALDVSVRVRADWTQLLDVGL